MDYCPLRKYSQSIQMFDIAFAQLTVLTDQDVAHGEVGVTRTYTLWVAVVEKARSVISRRFDPLMRP